MASPMRRVGLGLPERDAGQLQQHRPVAAALLVRGHAVAHAQVGAALTSEHAPRKNAVEGAAVRGVGAANERHGFGEAGGQRGRQRRHLAIGAGVAIGAHAALAADASMLTAIENLAVGACKAADLQMQLPPAHAERAPGYMIMYNVPKGQLRPRCVAEVSLYFLYICKLCRCIVSQKKEYTGCLHLQPGCTCLLGGCWTPQHTMH